MKNYLERFKGKFSNSFQSMTSMSLKDKINLLEQLSNLLNSGIPITNALKIIILQTREKKKQEFLKNLVEMLNKGRSLKECFAQYPKIFWTFDISIVEMWEVTGKLWDAIETIKEKEEKEKELKGKILWALIYPIVIVTLSFAMICVFMVYVIPKIQKMYKDAKVNLPDLTEAVIQISNFMQEEIIFIVAGFIFMIVAIVIFKNHSKTKIYFDAWILKIPLFGWLIRKKILSLFTSSLSTLLDNGIIIHEALGIASNALENKYYEKEIQKIIEWVSRWVALSTMMWIEDIQKWKENPYFPIELASVIKIWEQTWKMSDLLGKISGKYNKEVDTVVKNMQTAIEPMVIVGVGLIIWTIIMAIMLPFFNMVNVI